MVWTNEDMIWDTGLEPEEINVTYNAGEFTPIQIPFTPIQIPMETIPIQTRGRHLRANWTIAIDDELETLHGFGVEEELTNIMAAEITNFQAAEITNFQAAEITNEIDSDIFRNITQNAAVEGILRHDGSEPWYPIRPPRGGGRYTMPIYIDEYGNICGKDEKPKDILPDYLFDMDSDDE